MRQKIKCTTCLNEIEMSSICPICESENEVAYDKDKEWEVVYTTNNVIEAEMFAANIEGAEIPVHVMSQIDSSRMFNVGDLAIVKIFVPYPFLLAASRIIKSIEDTDIED